MSLTTTEKISLDFYNQSIISVNAKQYDTTSRYINVTCTDHGKKAFLDPELTTAYIRYKKNDGTFIFNDTQILDDGTILIELTQQMLTVVGRHTVDLLITSLTGTSANQLEDMQSIYDMGATIISTMQFYLNVVGSTLDEESVTSTSEYSALLNAMTRLARTEKDMSDLENLLNSQEEARQAAEIKRQDNVTGEAYRIAQEQARQSAEVQREQNVTNTVNECNERIDEAVTQAETATNDAIEATDNAETATQNAITATNNAVTATNQAKAATASANNVVQEFEAIKDQSGIIKQEEKGIAGGIATLNESGKVPKTQLDISGFIRNNLSTTQTGYVLDASQGHALNALIEDLTQYIEQTLEPKINNMHKVYFNDVVDNSIGKDGDILMVPISE